MSMSSDKKHGILNDPWRSPPAAPAPPKPEGAGEGVVFKRKQLQAKKPAALLDALAPEKRATFELRGYGAITVRGCETASEAAAAVLDFLTLHLKSVDPTLTDFGVLVTQTKERPKNTPFFIHRPDGWLLAIPGVPTREAGAMQLIQALIQINALPGFKKKLEDAGISAYKF